MAKVSLKPFCYFSVPWATHSLSPPFLPLCTCALSPHSVMSLLLSLLYYLAVCLINSTHTVEIRFSSLHVISCGVAVDIHGFSDAKQSLCH